ncbi:DUF3592 domain-containing protein [Hyphomicrobium sp. 1Nfss2.1]|uniref:hypothetical protein n=1 Tax=Hyphomicrobium sp. 1Nfss2.1 TaxID=3413936 RepID=UPI003C7E9B58
MADAAVMGAAAPASAPRERDVYAAGGGRKFAFSFAFLLLLPFFISLPPMLFWRVSQGHWNGTPGLVVLAIAFAFIMFLLVIELMHSLRARIELGATSVKMTLPSGRGPTPMMRYRSYDIPYDQIKAVETRREVYGGSVAPVLLQGARLILKDDTPVKLGYVSEANSDPCFPYPEIAQKIAARAGLAVEHKGNVRRSVQKKYFGLKQGFLTPGDDSVDDAEIELLNKSHRGWVMRLISLLVVMVIGGIALDIIFPPSSGLPPALTSVKALVMQGGTTAAPPAKKK